MLLVLNPFVRYAVGTSPLWAGDFVDEGCDPVVAVTRKAPRSGSARYREEGGLGHMASAASFAASRLLKRAGGATT